MHGGSKLRYRTLRYNTRIWNMLSCDITHKSQITVSSVLPSRGQSTVGFVAHYIQQQQRKKTITHIRAFI